MGLLDKLKRGKSDDTAKKSSDRSDAKETEVQKEQVLTPDGKLVEVEKKVSKKKSDKEKKDSKPASKKENTGNAHHVLHHPLITEKGSFLGAENKYLFAVAPDANKIEIKKAIKAVYGVDPVKVHIMNMSGKWVRYGRSEGRTNHWKKAIVSLPEGQKIDIQEGL